jgi:hypothetical protein
MSHHRSLWMIREASNKSFLSIRFNLLQESFLYIYIYTWNPVYVEDLQKPIWEGIYFYEIGLKK